MSYLISLIDLTNENRFQNCYSCLYLLILFWKWLDILAPSGRGSKFKIVNSTKAAEDAYDLVTNRHLAKPIGTLASVMHVVKCALGSGILSAHVAYMKAGVAIAVPLTVFLGIYMAYCLYCLGISAQKLYKRTATPVMSYPEIGEAAAACCSSPKVNRWAKCFGQWILTVIAVELFGACITYQIIISKTLKQVVENTQNTSLEGLNGGPSLKVYLAAMLIPIVLICLLRHLAWLAPFSLVANVMIVLCICMTITYAFQNNPTMTGMKLATSFSGVFECVGMIVFSMSCASQITCIEGNMANPNNYSKVLFMDKVTFICVCVVATAFFGYAAYLDKSEAPITLNYPMTVMPKIVKCCIGIVIYVTHALNFFIPFSLTFNQYIEPRIKNKNRVVMWELFFRALFVIIIGIFAILFPSITSIMSFLGCFCLALLAFIFPNMIELMVYWENPGLGKYKWRLWKAVILSAIGVVLWIAGSMVSGKSLFTN